MAYNYDLRLVSTRSQLLTYIGIKEECFDGACSFDVEEYSRKLTLDLESEVITIYKCPFQRHAIPKRNPARGRRIVWEAEPILNDIYKGLARRLNRFFEYTIDGFPHYRCFGYVRGKNIRDNAIMHSGAAVILKADIASFFPSITLQNIERLFSDIGVDRDISVLLGKFLTIDGRLPLGLPTSSIIANAICYELDVDLCKLAEDYGATYSRYADDLTFSSKNTLPEVSSVSEVVKKHGFELANDKTRFTKRGQNHYVTGLSVSDPRAPHAPRSMKRGLRQELHYAKMFGLRDHIERLGITESREIQRYINHLDGRVKYVAFQEPRKAAQLVTLWQSILHESGDEPSFAPKNQDRSIFVFCIDETEFEWRGRRYLALGLSASQQQDMINTETERVLKDYLANPFSDGNLDEIVRNGMHFYHASEDLKSRYVSVLQTLPFQGFIVFGEQTGNFERDYTNLLSKIIKRRLMAAESRLALFCFERSDKVSQKSLDKVVHDAWSALGRSNNRRPEAVQVMMVDKSFYGVGVPDFLLGVFRRYISGKPPLQRQQNMFEGLRDKIRVIFNADTGEEFTRRNPFNNSP